VTRIVHQYRFYAPDSFHVCMCVLYWQELRGLNFHLVLERLCLLHYGKSMCLSYPDQVKEYQAELWNVA
jgi:hypothetical protein